MSPVVDFVLEKILGYLSEINIILVSCRSRVRFVSRHNRNAGDFSVTTSEREMALKCGSLPRDAGDLAGLG